LDILKRLIRVQQTRWSNLLCTLTPKCGDL
jgi:hypothetical protein